MISWTSTTLHTSMMYFRATYWNTLFGTLFGKNIVSNIIEIQQDSTSVVLIHSSDRLCQINIHKSIELTVFTAKT